MIIFNSSCGKISNKIFSYDTDQIYFLIDPPLIYLWGGGAIFEILPIKLADADEVSFLPGEDFLGVL